jgi:pantetheine-phosphate adenylyltransferase
MPKLAVYPGSFDPITNGHVDLIKRAHVTFDNLVVAVAVNPRKNCLFSADERIEMIREALDRPTVRVEAFSELLVHYLKRVQANVVIRGLRAISDFDYEFQMALTNRALYPGCETFFLMASHPYIYLSSGMVKEIAYFGGEVDEMVPPNVLAALKAKMNHIKVDQLK